MTRIPIIKQQEYLEILAYFIENKRARSYHITKHFENMNKGKSPQNFSIKLQNLVKIGFIEVIKQSSRGRHGAYREYQINYENIIKFTLLELTPKWFIDIHKQDFTLEFPSQYMIRKLSSHFKKELSLFTISKNLEPYININSMQELLEYTLQSYLYKSLLR